MKTIGVGILGCSNIAGKYAIDAFKALSDVKLVAIASRDEQKAREWATRFNLEPESYESLLARRDIDVIYSPLPIGLQEEWVMKAAHVGKHMICEKSIADSYESAERMVAACTSAGVVLYENFVSEFHPQHKEIARLIADGAIGTPHVWTGYFGFPPFPPGDIRYSAKLKGGSLNDAGCYTVHMARKILKAEPIAVHCTLTNGDTGVDVQGSALLEFPHMTALMAFGFDHVYQNTYSMWGSKGLLRTDRAFSIPPTLAPHVELITNDGSQQNIEQIVVPAENQFIRSFEFVCGAIREHDTQKIGVMYDRILKQASVLEAMRVSAREGRRVQLV